MFGPAEFVRAFARNVAIVEMQSDGLTHQDSLIQTPYNVNCLNWVVGHLITGRDDALTFVGGTPVWSADTEGRYRRESDPILGDGPGVLPFPDLLQALAETQRRIEQAVGDLTEQQLAVETLSGDKPVSLASRLRFAYFHDTYHTGQTEILRQFAGKDDKVI
ncbi:MAG TPA: DinB family protein [Acidimicrobiia bacterium]|nr:DinB family protein [Acidimicrobiia bacterium]